MSGWTKARREALKATLIAASTIAGTRVEAAPNTPTYTTVADAANNLPKACCDVLETSSDGNAQSTAWESTADLLIDTWVYGVAQATPPLTAAEVAADRRDQLDAQVLKATVGNPKWMDDNGIARVTRVKTTSFVALLGEVVYGGSAHRISVEFNNDFDLAETEDLFELGRIDVGVADADGATDMTISAPVSQEEAA